MRIHIAVVVLVFSILVSACSGPLVGHAIGQSVSQSDCALITDNIDSYAEPVTTFPTADGEVTVNTILLNDQTEEIFVRPGGSVELAVSGGELTFKDAFILKNCEWEAIELQPTEDSELNEDGWLETFDKTKVIGTATIEIDETFETDNNHRIITYGAWWECLPGEDLNNNGLTDVGEWFNDVDEDGVKDPGELTWLDMFTLTGDEAFNLDLNDNGRWDENEWACGWNTHGQEYMLSPKINVETCTDGIHNGDEGDTDCGGVCGSTCENGDQCNVVEDCVEGLLCDVICQAPPVEEPAPEPEEEPEQEPVAPPPAPPQAPEPEPQIDESIILYLPIDQDGDDHSSNSWETDWQGQANIVQDNDRENVLELGGTADDYVIIRDFEMPNTLTQSFWMKTADRSKAGSPTSYATDQSDNDFLLYDYRGLKIYRGSNVATGISLNDGEWHHVAVTWDVDSGEVKLYKDGVEEYSGTLSQNRPVAETGAFVIGQEQDGVGRNFDTNQAFKGRIDELYIYNRVLPSHEIARLAGLDVSIPEPEGEEAELEEEPQEPQPQVAGRYVAIGRSTSRGKVIVSDDGGSTWELKFFLEERAPFYGLDCIDFDCWVVGTNGLIVHSDDGGDTWNRQDSTVEVTLRGVHFLDSRKGWAVGNGGTILKTTNGGETWIARSKTRRAWHNVFCLDKNECWIVGSGPDFAHTYDSGNDGWILEESGASGLRNIYFRDREEGWAVGANAQFLHGYFGGLAWIPQSIPEDDIYSAFNKVYFYSLTHGFMAGTRGAFLETIDGGFTWQRFGSSNRDVLPVPETWNMNDIFFFNENEGCMAGYRGQRNGRIFCTKNGGVTWIELMGEKRINEATGRSFAGMSQFHAIEGVPKDEFGDLWAFGTSLNHAKIIHSNTPTFPEFTFDHVSEVGRHAASQIVMVDPQHGWAVGDNGFIMKTVDGSTWNVVDPVIADVPEFINQDSPRIIDHLKAISCIDATICWTAGEGPHVYFTNNGGQNWQALPRPAGTVYSIEFFDSSTGYIGGNNVLARTDDGGFTWEETDTREVLHDIYCATTNECWAVGTDIILYTDDGGQQWSELYFDTGDERLHVMKDVNFRNPTAGYIVGYGGLFLTSSDYGQTWSSPHPGEAGATWGFESVIPFTPNKICVTGQPRPESTRIWCSTNSGRSWNEWPSEQQWEQWSREGTLPEYWSFEMVGTK